MRPLKTLIVVCARDFMAVRWSAWMILGRVQTLSKIGIAIAEQFYLIQVVYSLLETSTSLAT